MNVKIVLAVAVLCNLLYGLDGTTDFVCLDSPMVPAKICYCEDPGMIDTACDVEYTIERPFTCRVE